MSAEILPIPAIPSGLREAAARATLIPFVGAGVSRLAGCPGWSEFADGALQWFVDLDKFTYAQLVSRTSGSRHNLLAVVDRDRA